MFKKYLPGVPLYLIVSLTGIILAALLLTFLFLYQRHEAHITPAAAVFPKQITLASGALTAKSAILYDPATGKVLYAKNADVTMPLASLTKLMTAQVVLNNVPTTSLITL